MHVAARTVPVKLVVVYEESLPMKIGWSAKNTSKGSNAFGQRRETSTLKLLIS
jgi:hypothetical protein